MPVLIYAIITLLVWIYIIYRLFKDFKQHQLSAINETSDANSDFVNTSAQTENNNTHDTKILYGSIAIMLILYILLLFV